MAVGGKGLGHVIQCWRDTGGGRMNDLKMAERSKAVTSFTSTPNGMRSEGRKEPALDGLQGQRCPQGRPRLQSQQGSARTFRKEQGDAEDFADRSGTWVSRDIREGLLGSGRSGRWAGKGTIAMRVHRMSDDLGVWRTWTGTKGFMRLPWWSRQSGGEWGFKWEGRQSPQEPWQVCKSLELGAWEGLPGAPRKPWGVFFAPHIDFHELI